jgi:L-ribulose-5-phosphate 3-epimerase
MQGRLSPIIDGRIQAFPWDYWQSEFPVAARLGFSILEWTLDQERLRENPLLTRIGQKEIRHLMENFDVRVQSVTGDNFMQAPFYKAAIAERGDLLDDLRLVAEGCGRIGAKYLVMPLVDNGSLETRAQEEDLRMGLDQIRAVLSDSGVSILFESDLPPSALKRFIEGFDDRVFGINYDIGNSAALGFDPVEEISAYGARIRNVHVKDRQFGGTTVPLGCGNADFHSVFDSLKKVGYVGDFILQTARADDGRHAEALWGFKRQVENWIGDK